MILSTLENENSIYKKDLRKRINLYVKVTIFCLVFSFIYAQFSHGVSSIHITYLFLYPLCLGILVSLCLLHMKKSKRVSFLVTHLYHTGVTSLILSSTLRGIFEIAGTSSIYQSRLTIIGIVLIIGSILCFIMENKR